jgi:hypothetical protein
MYNFGILFKGEIVRITKFDRLIRVLGENNKNQHNGCWRLVAAEIKRVVEWHLLGEKGNWLDHLEWAAFFIEDVHTGGRDFPTRNWIQVEDWPIFEVRGGEFWSAEGNKKPNLVLFVVARY